MKRIYPLLLFLLAAGYCQAAEPRGISGPQKARIGQLVRLEKTTTDSGKWVTLPTTPNFAVVEAGRLAFFSAERDGVYVFAIVDPTSPGHQLKVLAQHTVIVGDGPQPDPDPEPDPDPIPPPPPGDLAVVVIVEAKSTPTMEQAATIAGLEQYLEEHKIWRRTVDQHKPDGLTGKTPAYLVPGLAAMADQKLTVPVLAVLVKSAKGGFVAVDVIELPATAEKAIAKVERYVK